MVSCRREKPKEKSFLFSQMEHDLFGPEMRIRSKDNHVQNTIDLGLLSTGCDKKRFEKFRLEL